MIAFASPADIASVAVFELIAVALSSMSQILAMSVGPAPDVGTALDGGPALGPALPPGVTVGLLEGTEEPAGLAAPTPVAVGAGDAEP